MAKSEVTPEKQNNKPDSPARPARLPFFRQGKQAEASESLLQAYRDLARSVAEAVITTDGDFVITGWNRAAQDIYGWQAEEAIGQPRSEVLGAVLPDGGAWDEELALTSGWSGEVGQRKRDGSRLAVFSSVIVTRAKNGEVAGLTFVNRDLTAQKLLEEKLQLAEADFQALAESIPQMAWLADERGQTYWYNRRWYDYTGTTLREMEGAGWQKVHSPDYLPRLMPRIASAFKEGAPWEDVFPLKGKDGRYRLFYTRASPIRNKAGKVMRWLGTNTDINELRDAQDALKKSEEGYNRLIEHLNEGYMLLEIIRDAGGRAQDLRCVAVNQAFEDITGVPRQKAPGAALSSLLPGDAPVYLENVTLAASSGQPRRFDWRSEELGQRFEASAYLPKPGYAVVLFRV